MNRELRILHVEDDELVSKAFRRMMRDHRVTSVASYNDAVLSIGLDEKFDVIITDYDLGQFNGGGLYNWIRECRPDLEKRVIFLSGNDKAREYGTYFLEKPCTKARILETINLVLEEIECSCATSHGSLSITS
jgi:DNA-binding response OmpR family regulator